MAKGSCIRRKQEETSQAQGFRAAWGLCEDPTSPEKETLWPSEGLGLGRVLGWEVARKCL